jgi:hypothetical protein
VPHMSTLSTPQPARHPQPTVKAQALAYVMFDRPEVEQAARFLSDFGLQPVRHKPTSRPACIR